LITSGIYLSLISFTVRHSSPFWKSPPVAQMPLSRTPSLGDVAFAPAVMCGVDGQAERGIAVINRATTTSSTKASSPRT
jgi:hypothetical protein